jgi:Domain of unknown function (DUF4234)
MNLAVSRESLLGVATRAAGFHDAELTLQTNADELTVSATGRYSPGVPVTTVVSETRLPAKIMRTGLSVVPPAALASSLAELEPAEEVSLSAVPDTGLLQVAAEGGRLRTVPAVTLPTAHIAAFGRSALGTTMATHRHLTVAVRARESEPHHDQLKVDPSQRLAELIHDDVIRQRDPLAVFGLSVITVGIYAIVWYYRANRELRELRAYGAKPDDFDVDPFVSTIAVTVGGLLIIPPYVSIHRTFRRIQRAERLAGTTGSTLNIGAAWLLFFISIFQFVFPLWAAYAQSHMNGVWRAQLQRDRERQKETASAEVERAPSIAPSPVQDTPPPPVGAVVASSAKAPVSPPKPPLATPQAQPLERMESAPRRDTAVEIARERFARGEITSEEYREVISELSRPL